MSRAETDVPGQIERARHGDCAAQDELFGRYRNYLELLARMSIPRVLQAKLDPSDIVQDVFVKAHQGFGAFRGATAEEMTGWLKRILANRLADANRRLIEYQGRRRRPRALARADRRALVRRVAAACPPPEGRRRRHGAQRREVGAIVADALARLKDDDREVDRAAQLRGARLERGGEAHGPPPRRAVRALWGRAFQRLGAVLEDKRWTTE